MPDEMWSEKYRPVHLYQIIGNEKAKLTFITWLKHWKPGSKSVLLYGPPGTGKTTLVQVASNEFGYKLIEMNASDVRTKTAIMSTAGPIARESSLYVTLYNGAGSILFLDEVDGIFGREDRGGIGGLLKIIDETNVPIILAANDPWNPKLRLLRRSCEMIRFYYVRPPKIIALLKRICQEEGVEAEAKAFAFLAEKSRGDVRSAINDLQSVIGERKVLKVQDVKRLGMRDRKIDVQEALTGIFFAKNVKEAIQSFNNSKIDYEMMLHTIHDNLPLQYSDPIVLASAYNAISRADIFFGRIARTQNWSLLKYAIEQMTAGISTIKKEKTRPVHYRFPPSKIMMLGRTKSERNLRRGICERVGVKCHVSRKAANTDFLPFLKVIFNNDTDLASEISSWLTLDNEMIGYLEEIGRNN